MPAVCPTSLAAVVRLKGEGRAYFEHRLAEGDTRTEAVRALRRRISHEVFRRMLADELGRTQARAGVTAAAA